MRLLGILLAYAAAVMAVFWLAGLNSDKHKIVTVTATTTVSHNVVAEDKDSDKGDSLAREPQASDHEALRASVSQSGISCGVELWAKKTLTDSQAGQVNLTPINTTVQAVDGWTGSPTSTRSPNELQTYTLTGTLTGYKAEADSDIHMVITSGSNTMISEIPNPGCASGSRVLAQITSARNTFLSKHPLSSQCFGCLSEQVTITGVGFFDKLHGQTGVAPNGAELHPVISFAVGSKPGPVVTTTPTTPVTTTTGKKCNHYYHHVYHKICKPYYYATP